MGRGGGGGRKRAKLATRGGGGGGTSNTGNNTNTGGQLSTEAQPAKNSAAANKGLKGVAEFEAKNPNLKVNTQGKIVVGSKGAPKVDASKFGSDTEAVQHLEALNIPDRVIKHIDGMDSAREVASLLPNGSKYLGSGEEGLGMMLPDGQVLRFHYGGGAPEMYYAGDAAVYSQWKTMAGKVTVEGKPFVEQAKQLYNKGQYTSDQIDAKAASIVKKANTFNPGLKDIDLHAGNFGRTPSGKWVAFDPGALGKEGDAAIRAWGDEAAGRMRDAAFRRGEAKAARREAAYRAMGR